MTGRSRGFPRVGRFHKGYDCKQVDALLRAAAETLQHSTPRLTAGDVRRAKFELVRNGYDVTTVDTALDELEERVLQRSALTLASIGSAHVALELEVLRRELSTPPTVRFPRARRFRRGHDIADVDALITRVSAALWGWPSVTVQELRDATFRLQRRGYDQEAVNEALDRLVELMTVMGDTGVPSTPPDAVDWGVRPQRRATDTPARPQRRATDRP